MKGEVRIVTQDGVTLATLRKNMHFGEMALIQEQISVRSTSAIANNNVTCAMLTC
jgi:CRP-like cAMP-binding protein